MCTFQFSCIIKSKPTVQEIYNFQQYADVVYAAGIYDVFLWVRAELKSFRL